MLEEEGAVIVGLLVGLNVIDANLCVKGEDLDSQVSTVRRRHHYIIVILRDAPDTALTFGCWNLNYGIKMSARSCIDHYFLSKVGVIDFSMYLKNDIDDYRSEER